MSFTRRQLEPIKAIPEYTPYMTDKGREVFNKLSYECFYADRKRLDKSSIVDLRIEHKLPIPLSEAYWETENDRCNQEWIELTHDTNSSIMHRAIYYRPLYEEGQGADISNTSNIIEILDVTAGRNNLTMMRISLLDVSKYGMDGLPLSDIMSKVVLRNETEYAKNAELTRSYNTLYPATTNDMRLSREQLEKALAAIGKPQEFELDAFLTFREGNRSLIKSERE